MTRQTNGDRADKAVAALKDAARRGIAWAKAHPDEAAVALVPVVALAIATARHPLSPLEEFIVAECSGALGALMLAQYRTWKDRPAVGGKAG